MNEDSRLAAGSLSAVLEEIRGRHAVLSEPCGDFAIVIGRYKRSSDDVPVLLAALDEVLKLADEWADTPWPEEGGDRVATATEQIRLDGIHLREAITCRLVTEK